jgi:hypothetical protein
VPPGAVPRALPVTTRPTRFLPHTPNEETATRCLCLSLILLAPGAIRADSLNDSDRTAIEKTALD